MIDLAPTHGQRADAETVIVIEGPFALREVLRLHLRGHGDPTMRLSSTEAWRAMRTPEGVATLRLAVTGRDRLRAQAWGTGAEWAVERAGPLVGADDDPLGAITPIRQAVDRSALLRRLVRDRPSLLRVGRTGLIIEALVPAILEQKVTGEEARRAWRFLVDRYGEAAPGPGAALRMRVPPAAATLAGLPYFAYHPAGVEQRRADVIRHAASRAEWLEAAVELGPAEADRRLQVLPGIGPWTAAEVTLRALGDPDAVPVGDYHLPHLVTYLLAGERRGTDERMLELLEPYRPHRARILRLLEGSGAGPRRRGPRMSPRRIERH
jgi:3-methyladenine DNA glycosylase/8-oxoguanine DNA glycosylase